MEKSKIFLTNKTGVCFEIEATVLSQAEMNNHINECKAAGKSEPVIFLGIPYDSGEQE